MQKLRKELIVVNGIKIKLKYEDLKEFITAYVTICEADDTIQRDDYKLLETDALDEANKKNKRMTELEKKLEYAQNVC